MTDMNPGGSLREGRPPQRTLSEKASALAKVAGAIALVLSLAACNGSSGGDGQTTTNRDERTLWVTHWNKIAIDASGLDHVPVREGEDRVFGEQIGPVRSIRMMAIVQIAVADAVAAITGAFRPYVPTDPAPGASMKAAIAQAAHDTLSALLPSQSAIFDGYLEEDLAHIEDGPAKEQGIELGKHTAGAILSLRQDDGSDLSEPLASINYEFSDLPGRWRKDPLNPDQSVLGSKWSLVIPFVMSSSSEFRVPPPPALESVEYAEAFEETKRLGGDGINTPTERTEEQTLIGLYWAYDGTPSLCAPPRLYNQMIVHLADQEGLDVVELARLLAIANMAMSDAGLASWESKFFYDFWRPVTGIREADEGTGPTGLGDGNPLTVGDPNFVPFGAPLSNGNGPNFTPPFPTYPSGHATFGGALFQVLRRYFGTDDISFTFVSDELNGVTVGNDGNVRPLFPMTFENFSEAERENGESRVYLGIHWKFDSTEGIKMGNKVGDLVFDNTYQRLQ